MANERVRRSIEFQFGVDADDLIKGASIAENSVAGLQAKLEQLKVQFEGAEIGSAEFNRLGNEIQQTSSKLKTLDERFEGLGIEQKNAMIVDSFNVVVGAVGAVTGALVAFGVESKALEGVEKRLLGIITVVSSLREVSNGLAAANKVLPAFIGGIQKAALALRAFALANPFTAIAIGIAAVTAAVFALIKAQDKEAEQLAKLKKLREEYNKVQLQTKDVRKAETEANIKFFESIGAERAAIEARIRAAQKEFKDTEEAGNKRIKQLETIDATQRGAADYNLKTVERQNEIDQINVNILNKQIELREAQNALIEFQNQQAEKSEKAAEDLAKRAAKQLDDERQGLENLIELTEELAILDGSAFKSKSSGQLEFNTELDRTNFLLKEQLDVLFSLNTEYEDLGDQLEEITDDFGESFFSKEQLEVFKKLRDAQKTGLQLQLENLRTTYLEDLALFTDNEEMKLQITEQYEKARTKLIFDTAVKNAQTVLGITSNLLSKVAQIRQDSLELELLQAQGNQARIDQINEKAFEQQKQLRIAEALITTAESILSGYNSTAALPIPFNYIAGSALALFYGGIGAKTIQTISSTSYRGGGSTGGFNNIPSGGFGSISLPGGAGIPTGGSQGAILPGLGGGRVAGAPTTGTIAEGPIRAYVLAGDVENGVQANIALNNRRRLAG